MNPLPVTFALIRRHVAICATFVILIGLAVGVGAAITAQERAFAAGQRASGGPLRPRRRGPVSLMPIIALAFDAPMVDVLYLDFLQHLIWMPTTILLLLWWIARQGWLRPVNAQMIS